MAGQFDYFYQVCDLSRCNVMKTMKMMKKMKKMILFSYGDLSRCNVAGGGAGAVHPTQTISFKKTIRTLFQFDLENLIRNINFLFSREKNHIFNFGG